MTASELSQWQAGFILGRAGLPYTRQASDHDVSDEFADGYAHGRAEFECDRAHIQIERNWRGNLLKMLRALHKRTGG